MVGLIIFVAAIALAFAAHKLLSWAFERASSVDASCALTGADVARILVGGYDVRVAQDGEGTGDTSLVENGWLDDHYDRASRTITLSSRVGPERSLAAVAVAAHEAGHVVLAALRRPGHRLRDGLAPASAVATLVYLVLPLFALLLVPFGLGGVLLLIAATCLIVILVLEIITLPIEIAASIRGMRLLRERGLMQREECGKVRVVLAAAALSYLVAALLTAVTLFLWVGDE